MRAVVENPQDYLEMEQKRRVPLGPFERSEVLEVRTSHFGVIPKLNHPGEWWLIVDLLWRSVNDEISGEPPV